MGAIGSGTEAVPRALERSDAHASVTLSVCCMTSGRRPELLAGVLAPLRELAGEIVVGVESSRAADVHEAVAGVADTVLAFPSTAPADRPIAWLFRACAGRWIFNIDDDEVPSPALVAALPALVERTDITHAWIPRRWVYPTRNTFIASAPWGNESQLRLVLADDRFLQFSDVFHRPVLCHGPSAYVDAPLWHLDTLLNPAAHRRRKAAAYERERAGMRIGGLAHNLGVYVPELHDELELAPVPGEDRAAIAAALGARPAEQSVTTVFVDLPADVVDEHWVGPPFADDLYSAELSFRVTPPSLVAGAQSTVDVLVSNRGGQVWRWGTDARPPVMLAYRWFRDGTHLPDAAALRTALPVDVAAGATELVPVHVVAPREPGRYVLEIDLLHEGVRRFGVPVTAEVDVRSRRRIAAIARPERLPELAHELALPPDVELVALLRDEVDRDGYGDYKTVVGLRPYLLAGTSERGRLRTLAALLTRTALVASRSSEHWSRPRFAALLELRRESDGLVVDSPNWEPDAAFGREWAWVAATALLWRLDGKQTFVREEAFPGGVGLRERAVRRVLRAVGRR